MRPSRCLLALLTGLAMALPGSLWAGSVRLLSADDRGVTLRLDLPARHLDPGAADRSQLVVPGFQVIDEPGRPGIPFVTALVALPPGAGATATLVSSGPEAVQSGVSLAIAGKPVVRSDERLGSVATREPVPAILDGAWP